MPPSIESNCIGSNEIEEEDDQLFYGEENDAANEDHDDKL